MIKNISKEIKQPFLAVVLLFAFLFAIIAIFGTSNEFPTKYDYNAEIAFSGEKSANSAYNVVWVKNIIIDGVSIPAAEHIIPSGWQEYAGYLRCDGFKEGKAPIPLNFSNVREVEIVFGRDKASGIAIIRAGEREQRIDLYGDGDIKVVLDMGKVTHNTSVKKILLNGLISLICFMTLAICIKINKRWITITPIFLWWLLFVHASKLYFDKPTLLLLLLVSAFSGYATFRSCKEPKMLKYRSKGGISGIVIISCYSAFAFAGEPLILKTNTVDISANSISYIILLILLASFVTISVLYFMEAILSKIVEDRRKIMPQRNAFWVFFLIMAVVYSVSIYIFAPGNVTFDNLNLIRDARAGILTLTHPIYYYWYVALLDKIDPSQFLNIILQSAFFCTIASNFMFYLHKRGLKFRASVIIIFLFAVYPSNSIGQVTQVKDYISSTAILWLALLILKLIDEKDNFWNLRNTCQVFLSLFIIIYFRPNGAIPGYCSIFLILIFTFKYGINRRKALRYITGCIIGLAVLGMITPIFTPPGAANYSGRATQHMNFLIAENYSGILNSGNELSEESTKYLESFLTREEWKSWYLTYNAQAYLNDRQSEFVKNVDTTRMLKIFAESVVKAPLITIKNKLNKTNILWDVTSVSNNQNYFHIIIYENELGIQHNDNILYRFIMQHVLTGIYCSFITKVLMNSGAMLIILFIIMLYSRMNGIFKVVLTTIPMWLYALFTLIICFWQDYRYYYYVFPITFFMLLIAITYCNQGINKGNQMTHS